MLPSCPLPQCPRLDAVGFIWELLPAAEGGHRAGFHAGADSRPGPAVLPLLHPLAAGQDHRGGSQQGAAFTTLTEPCHRTLADRMFIFSQGLAAGIQGQQLICISTESLLV